MSPPAYIEYIAAVGLASIDQVGLSREVAAQVSGIDFVQIYVDNTRALDDVLTDVEAMLSFRLADDGTELPSDDGTQLVQLG